MSQGDIGELPGRCVVGDQTKARAVAEGQVWPVGGDIYTVVERGEPSLHDVGGVEGNDAKGDIGFALGEAEEPRSGAGFRRRRPDRRS